VTLADTGEQTLTGGRLRRVRDFLAPGEPFCFTYGDGVAALDIRALVDFHRAHGRLATLTAVVPPGRYGALDLDGDTVRRFTEKPPGDHNFVNGGFFVLDPAVIDRIDGDTSSWEGEPLERLAADGQLRAFRHDGFWHAMDTVRDRNHLEELWASGRAPWKVW
jgi:glucose-1-phosphate cytidylyltransferase